MIVNEQESFENIVTRYIIMEFSEGTHKNARQVEGSSLHVTKSEALIDIDVLLQFNKNKTYYVQEVVINLNN